MSETLRILLGHKIYRLLKAEVSIAKNILRTRRGKNKTINLPRGQVSETKQNVLDSESEVPTIAKGPGLVEKGVVQVQKHLDTIFFIKLIGVTLVNNVI